MRRRTSPPRRVLPPTARFPSLETATAILLFRDGLGPQTGSPQAATSDDTHRCARRMRIPPLSEVRAPLGRSRGQGLSRRMDPKKEGRPLAYLLEDPGR